LAHPARSTYGSFLVRSTLTGPTGERVLRVDLTRSLSPREIPVFAQIEMSRNHAALWFTAYCQSLSDSRPGSPSPGGLRDKGHQVDAALEGAGKVAEGHPRSGAGEGGHQISHEGVRGHPEGRWRG
jgi:hypothetical protein